MNFRHAITNFDFLHHRHRTTITKRDTLYENIPAYILFHAIFGYVLLLVGITAIILRVPIKSIQRQRWLHPHMGYVWIFGTVWMAVTSIWCVHTFFEWSIVAFFIFSMYGAIQLGWLFVRTYRYRLSKQHADLELVTPAPPVKIKIWKWLHGVAMIYSFIMLLGAGISFPFRAQEDYNQK